MWNALSGQALARLVAYWLEVLRDDKGGKVRRFFRIKKALAGQTRGACLVDGWFEGADKLAKRGTPE